MPEAIALLPFERDLSGSRVGRKPVSRRQPVDKNAIGRVQKLTVTDTFVHRRPFLSQECGKTDEKRPGIEGQADARRCPKTRGAAVPSQILRLKRNEDLVVDSVSQLSRNRHRVKGCLHDLAGTTSKTCIACLRLNQLGVSENHAQLVVQAMKQRPRALGTEGRFPAGSLGRAHG